jgi:glycosyltransferase involved in cell wall biosynthesis
MRLTVLSVAYPFAPIGPRCVGGAEQILTSLDQALVRSGHASLILACEGSVAAGELFSFPCPSQGLRNEAERCWWRKQFQTRLDSILTAHQVDLIHMHGFDFHEYMLPVQVPVLVTLHMPFAWYPCEIWKKIPPNVQFQCVSDGQRLSAPVQFRNVPVIGNGVSLSALERRTGTFAIALGRICPEKNQHGALEAGFLANTPVLLGGQVFPWREHVQYYRDKVKPLLRQRREGVRHRFCGPLPPVKKHSVLAQAKCLLHPTLAPETSSLVAMEALAAGTPVIAYRSGALAEIVEHGVTGFLVNSVEEMAEAIHQVHTIRPEVCRATAERRFSKERMISQYFRLYQQMVEAPVRQRLHA